MRRRTFYEVMLASTCQEVMPERASGEVMRRKIAGGSEAATQEAKESQSASQASQA